MPSCMVDQRKAAKGRRMHKPLAKLRQATVADVHVCLDSILAHLWESDRATCRLVCRAWRDAHDQNPAFMRRLMIQNPDDLAGARQYAVRHASSIRELHVGGWQNNEPLPSYLMTGGKPQVLLKAILPHSLHALTLYANGITQALVPQYQQLRKLEVYSVPRSGAVWLHLAAELPLLQHLQLVVEDDKQPGAGLPLQLALPDALLARGRLETLVLHNMSMGSVTLSCAVSKLQQLTRLEVQRPAGIPDSLSTLTKLQWLELVLPGDFHLTIYPGLSMLSNLAHLTLEHCYFQEVPPPILALTKLTYLNLYGHSISTVEEHFFAALTNLQHLDLSAGPQQAFNHACLQHLTHMVRLTALHLGACSQQLPLAPGWGSGLQDLQLPSTRNLSPVPLTGHACYETVSSLDLGGNCLTSLPKVVMSNTMLQRLRIASNQLSMLPLGPCLLSMQCLDISDNCIAQLPQQLHMPALTSLNLEANLLKDLPEGSYLSQLTYLNLAHNFLTNVPAALAMAAQLRDLDLHHQGWGIAQNDG